MYYTILISSCKAIDKVYSRSLPLSLPLPFYPHLPLIILFLFVFVFVLSLPLFPSSFCTVHFISSTASFFAFLLFFFVSLFLQFFFMIFFLSFSILLFFYFFPGGMHCFVTLSLYDVHSRVI